MKNVIIYNIYVVGMHHTGVKQLEVGPVYYCKQEQENPKDPNAVAVFEDKTLHRRVCYLRREDAQKLKDVLICAHGLCYLKAKMRAEKYSKFKGPMQNCNIGFKCSEADSFRLESMLKGVFAHKIF